MTRQALDVAGTQTMHGVLQARVSAHPDRPFLVFEDDADNTSTTTYAQFAAQVDSLATALHDAGIGVGDKVAVMLANCPEFLVSWFGINQAGAVLVPVNVMYAADELHYHAEGRLVKSHVRT